MRTEIQETDLYKEFVEALNIRDMRVDDNPFVVKCCQISDGYATLKTSQLKEQLEEANFKLQDWYDTSKSVLSENCPQDEKHCACVPVLKREVKRLNNLLDKVSGETQLTEYAPELIVSSIQELLKNEPEMEDEDDMRLWKLLKSSQEETSLLKSQLEEAKEVFKVYDLELTAAKGEIERLKADLKYTYEYAEKQREVKQLLVDEPLANQSAAGWISVEERLPKHDERVLFYSKWEMLESGTYLSPDQWGRKRFCNGAFFSVSDVTHWMPLPPAPSLQENTNPSNNQ